MPSLTIHDLRRSTRSRLSELKVEERVAERAIGHGSRNGLIRIYDQHEYRDEIRAAFEAWHARLRSLVSPPPPNVVPLRASA
jgi:hypothetical protein